MSEMLSDDVVLVFLTKMSDLTVQYPTMTIVALCLGKTMVQEYPHTESELLLLLFTRFRPTTGLPQAKQDL